MADAALARREARRRKILENSHNRLQIISGKSISDITIESSTVNPIPRETAEKSVTKESNSVTRRCLNNGVINTSEDSSSFLLTNHESFAMGDGRVAMSNDTEAFISPHITPETPQEITFSDLYTSFIVSKYDIIVLSVFLQMLYYYCEWLLEDLYVFLPFFLYFTTRYFLFPKQRTSYVANVLLLINGMSSDRAHTIVSITEFASEFFQDMCIFLFSTICVQALLQTLVVNFG